MSDRFDNIEIDEVIKYNRKIVEGRRQSFGVDYQKIRRIFKAVNSPLDSKLYPTRRNKIIKKTSMLIGLITWEQPFLEGNRETALGIGLVYMNRNGYDLPFERHKIQIFELLNKLVYKFEGNGSITADVESLIKRYGVRI